MRVLTFVSVFSVVSMAAFAGDAPVLLALSQAGRIEIFDPTTLARRGQITVGRLAESVNVSLDGRTLYLAQERESGKCCGVYALNLQTLELRLFVSPAMFAAPTSSGRLVTQRHPGILEVYSAADLSKQTDLKGDGTYSVYPGPFSSVLFAITNTRSPALDVFDIASSSRVRHISLTHGPATGAWVGKTFYLFSYDDDGGWIWRVPMSKTNLPEPTHVPLPDLHGDCDQPVLLTVAGGPDRLYVAETFGFNIDRRRTCSPLTPTGIYAMDPSTGRVDYHIGEEVFVNRIAVSADGRELYVIDSPDTDPHVRPHLLRLDAWTGRILSHRELGAGPWNLTLSSASDGFLPTGYVEARRDMH